MSYRRIRHLNPAQIVGARGAWDARRTGRSDGLMSSWPVLPASSMAAPTQFAADNTRPILVNGVRAYVQFWTPQVRRFLWNGTPEKALFNNAPAGVILCAGEFGASNGTDQALVFFSTGTSASATRFGLFSRSNLFADRPVGGARRADGDGFTGAASGTAGVSGAKSVFDSRADWASGTVEQIRQSSAGREAASVALSGGAGPTSSSDSLAAAVGGRGYDGGVASNDRLHAFCVLRPTSPVSAHDAVLRRIQQHYCVTFGIPYRS